MSKALFPKGLFGTSTAASRSTMLELIQGNALLGARPSGGGLLGALPNLGKH